MRTRKAHGYLVFQITKEHETKLAKLLKRKRRISWSSWRLQRAPARSKTPSRVTDPPAGSPTRCISGMEKPERANSHLGRTNQKGSCGAIDVS
jgi:hypothetical protein